MRRRLLVPPGSQTRCGPLSRTVVRAQRRTTNRAPRSSPSAFARPNAALRSRATAGATVADGVAPAMARKLRSDPPVVDSSLPPHGPHRRLINGRPISSPSRLRLDAT